MEWSVLVLIGLVFAAIGAVMAGIKNRDPFGWAVLCFMTGVLGILALACLNPIPMEEE